MLEGFKRLLFGAPAEKVAAKGYFLGIGLNALDPKHYGDEYRLNACENDAKHMAHQAAVKGYETRTLLTKQATRNAVIDAIYELARRAQPGDIVAIHNSSHGSQVRDYASEEIDGMDETICMYDGQIIDDELAIAWEQFERGVRVLFTSDSCHSGTMLKAFEPNIPALLTTPGARALRLDVAAAVNTQNEQFYRSLKAATEIQPRQAVTASVLHIGACQDNQTALDGRVNGAFTGALLQTLSDYPQDCLGRVFTRVGHILAPSQSPTYMYYGPRMSSFESAPAWRI